jgi:hypothetical protein
MSTVAIKISAELAAATRLAAKAADRSLTGQIEHWAKIGRAAEEKLTAGAISALKQNSAGTQGAHEKSWEELVSALESVHQGDHFAATRTYLTELRQPLYEADPTDPEGIIQVKPDGSRTPGRMVKRQFVPSRESNS